MVKNVINTWWDWPDDGNTSLTPDKEWDISRILSESETISEKLSWLPKEYREVINQESDFDDEISENDVYEANLSEIAKKFEDNFTISRIFEALRKKWLRIFINPKTDISYTNWYNIIRGRWPVTQQSRYTMGIPSDAPDEEVYITKLIHEIGHSIASYIPKELDGNKKLSRNLGLFRSEGLSITKLWNLDRYTSPFQKAAEDWVEFIRMYIQSPQKFKKYLLDIFWPNIMKAQEYFYNRTKECVDAVLNKYGDIEK